MILCAAELAALYTAAKWTVALAVGAFAVFLIAAFPRFGRREQFLLVLSIGLTIAVAYRVPDPSDLYATAFDRAAFLAAFMILLALLREGAVQSPSVLAVGSYLTQQPPSRRYLSIHLGGHALGLLLNFGSLNLLGPLIMRGVAASTANPAVAEIRIERQISALSRGFSWMVAWSPTAITQALVFAVVPGIDPVRMILIGLILVALTSLAGWGLDGLTGRRARRIIPPDARPQFTGNVPFPSRSAAHFGLVCVCLGGFTGFIMLSTGVTTVPALMLAAPVVTGLWIYRQSAGALDRKIVLRGRLKEVAFRSVPSGSPEAATLACAGYCGVTAAGLVDPITFSNWAALPHWPETALYGAAMLLPLLLSNFGLPPLMVITFFGTLLSDLPGLDFDPTLLAMAFCVGWALNLTGSPFGVTAVILARITGRPGRDLTWRWNGSYTAVTLGISTLVLFGIAGL